MNRAGVAVLLMVAGCASSSPAADPHQPDLVAGAAWSHPASGYRLQVRPTGTGRTRSTVDAALALSQSLAAAGPAPVVITPAIRASLTSQLRCHAAFAPLKPKWNLETWRANVGYVKTVLHECNP
jgi:hypothetical protein